MGVPGLCLAERGCPTIIGKGPRRGNAQPGGFWNGFKKWCNEVT